MSQAETKPESHEDSDLKCGDCQWFAIELGEVSCQKARLVRKEDQACVEFAKPLPDLASPFAKDKYIQGLRKLFSNPKFLIPSSLIDELNGYLHSIPLNFPHGTYQELEALASNLKMIHGYYARVAEISSHLTDVKYDVEELTRLMSMWMYTKYPVVKNLKNDAQRQAAFDAAIPEAMKVTVPLRKALAISEIVDDKLSKSAATLKAILGTSEKVYQYREAINRVRT